MIEESVARMRAHQNNIHRYRRLLSTKLTEIERQYLERRLSEEQSAMEMLSASSFPIAFEAKAAGRMTARPG